ncbi:hypothetical protein JCM11251_001402 [Rhodosporidiobolus azoricus]
MHAPFELSPLIGPDVLGSEPITAVLLHADRVVLGTEKGALLVFDLSAASTSTGPPSATLVSRHDGFSKKAIDQLGVIKELNGMLCLSGGDVSLYSFSDFALLSSFTAQTRASCSLFELSTSIRSSTASEFPQIHTTLALACKRRLLLLSWTDATWNPIVEVSLPHQIRGMAFTEEGTKIVAGFSTGEYGIITLSPQPDDGGKATAELGELFHAPFPVAVESSSRVGSLRGATSLPGFGALGGLGSAVGLGALPGALGKKLERNGVVAVPRKMGKGDGKGKAPARNAGGREEKDDRATSWLWGKEWGWDDNEAEMKHEVLVVRDNMALPLDSHGKPRPSSNEPSHPATLAYPSVVDESVVLPPYVLSVISPPPPAPATSAQTSTASFSLAIHSVDTLSPIQTLSLPPRPVSPPASIAESTRSTAHAALSVAAKVTPPPPTIARHLTISPSSAKSPALILTASPPTGSIATGGGFPTQTLWIASMRSWQDQFEFIGSEGRWDEALALLRRSTAPLAAASSLPKPLLTKLATLHGLSLFRQKKYKHAIDAFIKLDVSPARVVALYEEAISGKVRVDEDGWEELFGGRTKEEVVKTKEVEARRKEEEAAQKKREQEEKERMQTSSPAKGRKGPLSAVVGAGSGSVDDDDTASIHSVASRLVGKKSWLREGRDGSVDEGREREAAQAAEAQARKQAKLAAADRSLAVDELIRYLTDRRQKYSLALSALLPSSRPSPSSSRPPAPASELLSLPNIPLTDLPPDELARAAQIVDTALFRAYLATKPVMVGPLCRIENWCEVEEVEELLMGKKKYHELLDLYNGKNMHERAVKLLRQMSEDEDDPEEKVDPTVRYLQKLGPEHVEVIYDASRWVFEQDKNAGLQIFVADIEEVEALPRHSTMSHLEKVGRDVCIRYLEHIIHELGERGADFHEKLIDLCLAEVVQGKKATGNRDEAVYCKLLDLLESSTSYRADRILGRLPSEDMHEVRAVLLGRLGRHEGALQIYVYQLEDHQTAEQYCMRVYNSDESMRSTIFHILLRLYLRPRPKHPLLFGPALSLLSTHAARIDPLEAFDLLPPLVAVSDIKVYLEKTLRKSGEKRREVSMVKGVAKAWTEEKEREVVKLEERRVKISEGRVCPVCSKRIGNSVIAVHNPRGEVTHYQCREQFMSRV